MYRGIISNNTESLYQVAKIYYKDNKPNITKSLKLFQDYCTERYYKSHKSIYLNSILIHKGKLELKLDLPKIGDSDLLTLFENDDTLDRLIFEATKMGYLKDYNLKIESKEKDFILHFNCDFKYKDNIGFDRRNHSPREERLRGEMNFQGMSKTLGLVYFPSIMSTSVTNILFHLVKRSFQELIYNRDVQVEIILFDDGIKVNGFPLLF